MGVVEDAAEATGVKLLLGEKFCEKFCQNLPNLGLIFQENGSLQLAADGEAGGQENMPSFWPPITFTI